MHVETPAPAPVPVVNLANGITVARVLLVPIMAVLFVQDTTTTRLLAAVVFLVAAITDKIDGYIARSRGLETAFGAIVDPIADKALVLTALVLLSAVGDLPWWVTIVIIARELAITVLRFVMIRRAVMAASKGGKLKTLLQVIFITGFLTPWHDLVPTGLADVMTWLSWIVCVAAVLVTVVSAADYVVRAWRIAQQGPVATADDAPENPAPEDAVPDNPVPDNPVPDSPVPDDPVLEDPAPEDVGGRGTGAARP